MSLFAGVVGTLAVEGAERVERRLLGDEPLYSSRHIARRLFGERAPHALLRWSYGPLLGVIAGRALESARLGVVAEALVVGAGVCAFELLAMPAVGATPPVSAWPRRQVATLVLHTLAFGVGFSLARALMRRA